MPLGPTFRKLWIASAVSNLGDGARLTALPLLAATVTRDPGLIAGVLLATRLPWLLLALVGGAVADRVDRRRLMATMQAVRCGLMALLTLAVMGDWAALPLVYSTAFLLGVAEVLFDVAAQSILPAIVERDQLDRANGRLLGVEIVANEFAGGPLGGALFALGRALPFGLSVATFGTAGLLVTRLQGSFAPTRPSSPTTVWRDIREGVTWLVGHRFIRTMALMVGVMNMMLSANNAILVLFALERLGIGEVGFGLLLVPIALGSTIGSLLADRLRRSLGVGVTLIGSVVMMGSGLVGIGLTTSVTLVVALSLVIGAANMTWNVITVSLRQSIIPDHLLGRINSVYRLLAWGTMPIGAGLGGFLASVLGLASPFLIGGVVFLTLAALTWPVVNSRTVEEARAADVS
jgi:MFS family permease